MACRIQGGAGPRGCDTAHWCDALLCYGAHCERLRDSVAAAVARHLCNTITPWDDVRSVMLLQLLINGHSAAHLILSRAFSLR